MTEKPTYEELEQRVLELEKTELERKIAVDALRESEANTKAILEAMPDLMFRLSTEGEHLEFFAPSIDKLYPNPEEFLGKRVNEVLPREVSEKYQYHIRKTLETCQMQVFEYQLDFPEGPRHYESRMAVSGETETLTIVRDITERKRNEEALRESQEKYREIANRVPGMVYQFVRHQDGSLSVPFISNRVYEYSGYNPEEVMAEPNLLFKPVYPEDIELIQKQITRSAKSLNEFSVEHRLTTPDGKILWFHVKLKPRLLENGDISWNGISIDITERKYIEEELKKSEERYQSVSELTSDYSYAYRVEPDGGLILEWVTGALKRLTGFTMEEVGSRGGWESLIYPEDMSIPLGQFKTLLSNQSKTVEYRITDKAGKIRWMRDFAKPIWDDTENRLKQIYGAVQEFTKQKEAEEALRSSHERFLTVMDSIDATIYVADMETYEILFMNKHMIESFGRDMTGEICWDVFRNESGPCPHCTNDRLINAKAEPTGVYAWQDKNPITRKWYMNYDRAIKWIDDRIVRLQIATDITDLKALEDEKMNFEEKLRQAQKMEAIGTLAGGIAHDFNNILSAIIGYTELALIDAEKSSSLYHNLKEVLLAGARAKDLVKQILTFSRQVLRECKPIQIKPIVSEGLKFLRASLPTTLEIQQDIQSDALVMADPTQIHQVIMNLCTNAEHAMREKGGVLGVKLVDAKIRTDFTADHPELKPGTYLELTVSDTGHGIPASILDRIFDPFFTTKETGEGTGMGLSVVHGIVRSYDGAITASSELGKGSAFKVYLPVIDRQLEPQAAAEESIPTGTERILFVDDEPALVNIGKQTLETLGYDVQTRTSSIEALELFKAQRDRFHLVITDMTMPNMTGEDLAQELMRIKPSIPIILCTGFSAKIDDRKAGAMGIRAFVLKPIVIRELAITIRKVLDQTM